jgi:essential nuclear protein 1
MPKAAAQRRQNPLENDIIEGSGRLRTKSITGKRKSRSDEDGVNEKGDGYIDARASRKILAIAQDLADEDVAEQRAKAQAVDASPGAFGFDSRFADGEEDQEGAEERTYDKEDEWFAEEDVEDEDVDPKDLAVYKRFLNEGEEFAGFAPSLAGLTTGDRAVDDEATQRPPDEEEGEATNLADLILQRIAEKEALEASQDPTAGDEPFEPPEGAVEIPTRVFETFTKVGQLLSRYKSGPLPKPFKVLPTLPQWPDLLEVTRPDRWTPHAVYRATKIFISAPQATGQHFCSTVLLERVRDDIQENKKLNPHLYQALMAAFYRPAAFFKGFLFPLVQNGCTLREAQIISSVLAKHKIPVLHSAAALLRLCEICAEQTSTISSEAAGAANIFIRVLLGKKYALPYKVVDALVFHFLRFRGTKEEEALGSKEAKLPVLWHQSFLIFAQTYRNEITEDQREALLDLLLAQGHKEIGPEVRRELLAGRTRGGDAPNDERRDDGDDTMDVSMG